MGFEKRASCTLRDLGDGDLTSDVAKAGALVVPILILSPCPVDFLRRRVCDLLALLGPAKAANLSLFGVVRSGNASVVVGMMKVRGRIRRW